MPLTYWPAPLVSSASKAELTARKLDRFLTYQMPRSYIFSSESVGEGHPDKVCDTISDAVLDACLAQDSRSRVACETYAKSNIVVVGGEITTRSQVSFNTIVRETIREIGYTNEDDLFHAD